MEKIEKPETNEILVAGDEQAGLYGFFARNRRRLFISGIVALVLLAGFVAALLVRDKMIKDATAKLDVLAERYDEALNVMTADGPLGADALLDDLTAFGKSAWGYPAARAWFMAADIYHERQDWENAREAWGMAAAKGAATHLAPVSLFNAAVAAEEAGDPDAALENYKRAFGYADFPEAARAQFAAGRIEEKKGNTEAAVAAYNAVIDKWPQDTDWTNLAHSRILALELAETGK
ncbi:MAG: tetratricopeptide repeat protein [Spirochaetaceae bacterium]|jgi:tetratricopeptide (TPR) repeat protein|nr:tetratricopeptide repeat protein [Spirochaetaceae bacterium]